MGSGTLDSYPLIADQTNATLGSEEITCGDFGCAVPTDSWIEGTGWLINGGKANASGTSTPMTQAVDGFIAGKTYKVSFEVTSVTQGYVRVYAYAGASGAFTNIFSSPQLETGIYEDVFEFGGTNKALRFYGSSGGSGSFIGSIDNISVKQVNGNPAIMTNMTASDIENGSPYANLVQNGTFDTDSDWYLFTGSTISGGVGNVLAKGDLGNTGGNWCINQNVGMILGSTYKVSFKARQTVGTGIFQVGQAYQKGFNQSITSVFVDYSFYITALDYAGNTGKITIGGETVSDEFEVDNISVKEVTRNNLARVDYDGTASSLLVEPERTNLVTYSEDFSNAYWLKVGTTVVSGQTSPSYDSPTGAFKLVEGTTSAEQGIRFTSSITSVVSSFSVMAKYNGRYFRVSGNINVQDYVNFNLQNGTITRNGGGITNAKIEHIVDEWYRCTGTYTGGNMNIGVTNDANATYLTNYTGDGVSGVYIFGSQFEAGSYPTSYIPTSGSTVTRVQDQYSKTGISNLINSEEGVLFVEMAALANDLTYRSIGINSGSATNRILISFNATSNNINALVQVGGVTQASINYASVTITNFNKIAYKWKVNDFALWVNGVEVGTDTSGSSFSANTLTTLDFTNANSADNLFAKVKQLQIFETALTDTELATLTS
jgi:hypothetical protein